MATADFDSLAYFGRLKQGGVPDPQAEALQGALDGFAGKQKDEIATKGDLKELELRLQAQIHNTRMEIKAAETRLLKWQWGFALALAAIMAKGFGWLGF